MPTSNEQMQKERESGGSAGGSVGQPGRSVRDSATFHWPELSHTTTPSCARASGNCGPAVLLRGKGDGLGNMQSVPVTEDLGELLF